jgi:Helix-turn-helix domain
MPFATDEFPTVADLARGLRLAKQIARSWIDQATLSAFRIGRDVRIAGSDFDRLVETGYRPATSTSPEYNTRARAFWDGSDESAGDIDQR